MELDLRPRDFGASLRVRVKPRASKSRILGVKNGSLEVAVAAPPVDGEANAELVRVLAHELGLSKRSIRIVNGEASREKLLHFAVDVADLVRALGKVGVS